MALITRRTVIGGSGALLAAALAGCADDQQQAATDPSGPLTWWDSLQAPVPLHKEMFAEFERSDGGKSVQYTRHDGPGLGRALQLAKQSDQLPDVFSLGGLGVPSAALVQSGWFQPLDLGEEALGRLGPDAVQAGITKFDDKTYSFPIFSPRDINAFQWFLADRMEQAGLDPEAPPATYDEFRAACRTAKQSSGGSMQGWMAKLGAVDHMASNIECLVQAAGFRGMGGVDFTTGEYAYHTEPYLTVLEFLLSLQRDKLMVEGSVQLKDSPASNRWASGEALFLINSSHIPGVIKDQAAEVLDQIRVGPLLVPDQGQTPVAYTGPPGGSFWLSAKSPRAAEANALLRGFTTKEYHRKLGAMMGRPPYDLAAVTEAEDILPAYRQAMAWNAEQVFLGPAPVVRNVATSKVAAEMKQPEPDFGDIVEGLFTGAITDARKALTELSSNLSAERERAIAKVAAGGDAVAIEDWVFPNWTPSADYTQDQYDSL